MIDPNLLRNNLAEVAEKLKSKTLTLFLIRKNLPH